MRSARWRRAALMKKLTAEFCWQKSLCKGHSFALFARDDLRGCGGASLGLRETRRGEATVARVPTSHFLVAQLTKAPA